ncbi:MAG: hypothetical protein CVU40_16575 [Chloroflexi bacterium HGW-Chloroflexi-2]|nr:MAG: hypothetical protein CVU40_16575 [Chloroflexi bacterium HGW-Chloroflexi-2]
MPSAISYQLPANTIPVQNSFPVSRQPSAVSSQPSAVSLQPSAISRQPSAVSHQPSAVSLQQSAFSRQPSAVSLQQSAISRQPSAVSHQQSAISRQPSAISRQPSAISFIMPFGYQPSRSLRSWPPLRYPHHSYPICQKPAKFHHFCLKTCTFRQVDRVIRSFIIERVFYQL